MEHRNFVLFAMGAAGRQQEPPAKSRLHPFLADLPVGSSRLHGMLDVERYSQPLLKLTEMLP